MATPLPNLINNDPEVQKRRNRYAQNWRYYNGQQQHLSSRRDIGRRGRMRNRNLVALLVNTVTDYMGHATVLWEGGEHDAAQQFVAATVRQNGGALADFRAELQSAVAGDAAWKVTWDDRQQRVVISQADPAGLYVITRPDDPNTPETVAQQYQLEPNDGPVHIGDTLFPVDRRTVVTEEWNAERWRVWFDSEVRLDQSNPYGAVIPFVLMPNLPAVGLWGSGDPEPLLELQDAYNEAAHDTDEVMRLASSIVVLQGVDEGTDIAVRPGAVWELPDDAQAYVLDLIRNNHVGQRMEYKGDIRRDMFDVARVPEAALGLSGRDVSGVALQIELGPLQRLVARKRLTREHALIQRAQTILAIGHRFGVAPAPPEEQPTVAWEEPLPTDRQYDLQVALDELAAGRSREAVLAELGVDDPRQEIARRVLENDMLEESNDRTAIRPER